MPYEMQTWETVWQRRTLDPAAPSTLAALMAADGHDTGFGDVSEANFCAFVEAIARRASIGPGDSLYDVGCGGGAFLYPLAAQGVRVGGLDRSQALVQIAREHLPQGEFDIGDAVELPLAPRYDAVVSCGVFMYFPSLAMAGEVIARMMLKARRVVALLDLPDIAQREAALAMRRGLLGAAEYEAKYRGLDHMYYDRAWVRDALLAAGATHVTVEDQCLAGCRNAQHRFNALAEIA